MFQRSRDLRVATGVTEVEDDVVIEGRSLWRLGWRRLKQDRVALAGGVALIAILLVAGFASQLIELVRAPAEPVQLQPDQQRHDDAGRQLRRHLHQPLARRRTGERPRHAGEVDRRLADLARHRAVGHPDLAHPGHRDRHGFCLLRRHYSTSSWCLLLDVLLALPGLLAAVTLVSILSQSPELLGLSGENLNFVLVIAVLGFFGFAYLARLVRGQVISLREQEFVLAARSLGASDLRIMIKELLPNLMGPLLVWTTLTVPTNILAESAMSYLGLGVQPPTASWGGMISSRAGLVRRSTRWACSCPGWRCSSPCWRSTCSATACATRWTPSRPSDRVSLPDSCSSAWPGRLRPAAAVGRELGCRLRGLAAHGEHHFAAVRPSGEHPHRVAHRLDLAAEAVTSWSATRTRSAARTGPAPRAIGSRRPVRPPTCSIEPAPAWRPRRSAGWPGRADVADSEVPAAARPGRRPGDAAVHLRRGRRVPVPARRDAAARRSGSASVTGADQGLSRCACDLAALRQY